MSGLFRILVLVATAYAGAALAAAQDEHAAHHPGASAAAPAQPAPSAPADPKAQTCPMASGQGGHMMQGGTTTSHMTQGQAAPGGMMMRGGPGRGMPCAPSAKAEAPPAGTHDEHHPAPQK